MNQGRNEAVALVRLSKLFASLPEAALERLTAGSALRRVPAGEWLFRRGDEGESLFVVVSGRLETIDESPPPGRVVRLLGRGEVVGEVALITGISRSASVRARRDTELLEISSAGFRDLLLRHTDVALELLQLLARRLATGMTTPSGPAPRTVAIIDLRRDQAEPIVTSLADTLGGRVAIISRDGLPPETSPGRLVDELEQKYETVVLATARDDRAEWLKFCRRQADRVVCVGDTVDPLPHAELSARLAGCDLALTGRPRGRTGSQLDALQPRAHHWLDLPRRDIGMARLVRRMRGQATGIVLSGGGARGFAHIGVLERLRDRGVTIDRIGGCSMGAFVAGLAAVGLSAEESVEICRREFARRNPFNDYTVPRVALIRARKAAAMLERVFGDAAIEDCAVDYFCVSCDLVSADLVVHRRGSLRQAVGASMSIPGFMPPAEAEGRLLVDGGVLDNLPVDVMSATGEGPVLAVDVMGRTRLGRPGRRPTLVETLARATVLGSWQRMADTAAQAELVITPDVQAIGLVDFHRIEEAVNAGRRAVDAAAEAGLLQSVIEHGSGS